MANRNQLSYGSQGSDVTELQKLLNQNGYKLDEDGIFGANTQKAVQEYQKANGLDVDGIVGNNTWGALTKANTGNAGAAGSAAGNGFQYNPYEESDTVKQAYAMLQQQINNKPGAYQSAWQSQLNDVMQKILNREKFTYDLNGDALYQQYKDQYTTQGKMAMMDTMGQAAAMTGGYGNSYAQGVGQQAYQGYLQQLNDKVPELYRLAMDKYQMEGNELLNQYGILGAQEEQDYGRYRDQVGDWQTERDRLQNQYYTERDYDYGKWADGRDFGYGQYIDDRNYQYQQGRDQVADAQWQKEFDEALRQFNFAHGLGEFAPAGDSGSGGGGAGSGKTGIPALDYGVSSKWAKSDQGQEWLKTADGKNWLKTKEGQIFAGNNPEYVPNAGNNPEYVPNTDPGPGGVIVYTYADVEAELNEMVRNGAPKSTVSAQLRDHYNSGNISQSEYNALKEIFVPRGSTY